MFRGLTLTATCTLLILMLALEVPRSTVTFAVVVRTWSRLCGRDLSGFQHAPPSYVHDNESLDLHIHFTHVV